MNCEKNPMTPLNYSMTINKNLFRAPLCKWLYWKFRQSQILLDRYFCAHGVKWTFASLVTLPLIVLIHRTKFLHFYILMNWISLSTYMRQPIPSLINLSHSWRSKVHLSNIHSIPNKLPQSNYPRSKSFERIRKVLMLWKLHWIV